MSISTRSSASGGIVMRNWIALALVGAMAAGCTAPSVRDHTVNQALSVADMRYQEVLDNLALVAHNTGVIPSFGVPTSGIANVTNMLSADPNTVLSTAVHGFASETLSAFGSHNPELLWTITPIPAEPNLEALKYACLWVLSGPPSEGSPEMDLLRAPNRDDVYACQSAERAGRPAGYHFDVADKLARIPQGWLHIGTCLPQQYCYGAHCCDTCVWVTKDGLAALSDFTLLVLDIATLDPASLVLQRPTAKVEIQLKEPSD